MDISPIDASNKHYHVGSVFSPVQITMAGFFGSLPPGLVLLSWNFFLLGYRRAAYISAACSTCACALAVWALLAIPPNPYDSLWPFMSASLTGLAAHLLQSDLYHAALLQGANRKSWGWVVLIVVVSVVIVVALYYCFGS